MSTALAWHDEENFFRYTSGRWLWDEQTRLDERYRRFDVSALQSIATRSARAKRCVSMEKLGEGGSNKIFRLSMDNGKSIIARIPHRKTEWSSMTVASEVATMDFAARILGIPVPEVLAWDASSDNAVRTEYIIMEEASGDQLGKVWENLDIDEKANIVEQLASISSKCGSLYFATDKIPGCQPAAMNSTLPSDTKAEIARRYAIGPVAEESYWMDDRAKIAGVHGPWREAKDWLRAIAIRERTWLSEYARPVGLRPFQASAQGSPAEHISLYNKFLTASDHLLPNNAELLQPTLWHWDLHAPNIFVTKGNITSIIDWQDCCVAPLFFQARRPTLLQFTGESMLSFPDYYKSMDEGPGKTEIRNRVERSILLRIYDQHLCELNPVIDRQRVVPQASTIKEISLFAMNTWDVGIIPFRESLIRIQKHWSEICPKGRCPFEFTSEELEEHAKESEGYDSNAEFWSSISGLVSRDGFVLKEDYDQAFELFAKLRKEGLRMLDDQERDDFDKATAWAAVTSSLTT